MDVLEMLPLDVVENNVWSPLSLGQRSNFRLTCRSSRKLVDTLITSATHHLGTTRPARWFSDSGDNRCDTKQQTRQRRRRLELSAAFLSRTPRLQRLELRHWPTEADLVSELAACGAATRSRVTQLTLALGRDSLWPAALQAAHDACPLLSDLTLWLPLPKLQLHGALLQPFHSCQLTKLVVQGNVQPESLASLGALSRLRHLQLTLRSHSDLDAHLVTGRHHLAPLSGLISLRHCDVDVLDGGNAPQRRRLSLTDVSPLLASTHLTSLRLLNVAITVGPGAASAAVSAALVRLGGLACLRSLELSRNFVVGDRVFSALGQLTGLTRLQVGAFILAAPAPGHLPLLQKLSVNLELTLLALGTMQALRRLPALTQLNGGSSLLLQAAYASGDDADTAAAALRSVVEHLAAAPRLQVGPKVRVRASPALPRQLSLLQVAVSLAPLSGRISHLSLRYIVFDKAPWHELHLALPGLRELKLRQCRITAIDLLSLLPCLPALRRLHLCYPRSGVEQLGHAGWVLLAGGCSRPLQLKVEPELGVEVVAGCRAAQQRMYGRERITWVAEAAAFESAGEGEGAA